MLTASLVRKPLANAHGFTRSAVQELAYPEVQRPAGPATAAYREHREKVEAAKRAKAEIIKAAAAAQKEHTVRGPH